MLMMSTMMMRMMRWRKEMDEAVRPEAPEPEAISLEDSGRAEPGGG